MKTLVVKMVFYQGTKRGEQDRLPGLTEPETVQDLEGWLLPEKPSSCTVAPAGQVAKIPKCI